MLRKILKITGISLGVLLVILFVAPFIFKGKIIAIAKEQINKNINAQVDFKDLSLSFFRHFPRVSVALEELQVVGTDVFAKDTLISAKEIDVAVNLFSVIGGKNMKIYSVNIDEPRIHALVTKEGKANWDIAKPDTATAATTTDTASSPFQMNLQHYAIRNAYIKYDDAQSGMSTELVNLTHEGSGDFTSDLFTLKTNTNADAVTFVYGGIPYLNNTKTGIDLDIVVDTKNSKYSWKTEEIALNGLKLATDGFFQLVNDSTYNMDINFKAPSTDFKSILSLIPAVYAQDFEKIKTSGKALFNGFIKGTYGGTQIPAYNINLEIQDGFFQYPDLPKPVQHINLVLKVNNPDGVTDNAVVDIPKGHIEFGTDPFDFHVLFQKPLTTQYIDAGAKGKLDLATITQFVKLPGTKLAGNLDADVQAKGSLAVVQKQQPGDFTAKGYIDISKLFYSSTDFPQPIQNTSARINFESPDALADHAVITIPTAHIEIGKDVVDLSLLLKTLASNPYFDGTAKGSFNLANVAQFYKFEPGTSLAGNLNANVSVKGNKSAIDKSQYDAIQTAGTVQVTNVSYKSKDYPDGVNLKNTQLTFNPKNVTVNDVTGNFQGTNFNANGHFDNLIGYALKDETLAGVLNVSADKVDLNKLMGTTPATAPATAAKDTAATTATPAAGEPFAVPKNLNLTLNAKAGDVKYDKVDYKNIAGTLAVKDETVSMKDVKMEALDGTIALGGSYSTKESKKKPAISLTYDIQSLDIQKTFLAYNTVQKLMPIGQFISGKLTSKLTLNGKLGETMMPDLSSLTGNGSLLLLEGVLNKFAPLDKLASALDISSLKAISLKDVKSYFDIADGKVFVKPFNVKVQDMDMEIGGKHGLDQSIDYVINMKVPREKLGSKANALVNNLVTQANTKGIPVKVSDMVNFKVNLGGSITSPTVKTDLAGSGNSLADDMKDQAKELVQAQKAAAKDTLQSVKNQAVQAGKDYLTKQLLGQKDSTGTKDSATKTTKQKAEESVKGLMKGLFKKKN
ncbi:MULTISPECIES: AsmA-like C-terminal region-containing protein [Niastella]|uniref:AsmA-like C-terminal domain-containing protein n=1 Tax=Niastella soli TaxID=2821487 RepID=A0ABS3YXQ1_9BACT|nr:AsmA-like C-terminal region-containing protein [Niastella soli]MBO9202673.1 hypothetical protein [Niastella soli]